MDKSKQSAVSILVSKVKVALNDTNGFSDWSISIEKIKSETLCEMQELGAEFKNRTKPPWRYYLIIQKVRGRRLLMWRRSGRDGLRQSFVSLFETPGEDELGFLSALTDTEYAFYRKFELRRRTLNANYTVLHQVANYYNSIVGINLKVG